jgi:hypothetical protein
MIYLIGVDHIKSQWEYQDGSNTQFVSCFTNTLRTYIKELKVTIIGEELNHEILEQQGVERSTAQIIAEEFCLKHIFCEPSAQERIRLGILSKEEISQQLYKKELWQIPDDNPEQQIINEEHQKYFSKRERFWLDKIKDCKEEIILFIYGKSHVGTFRKLLEDNTVKVAILAN